MRPARLWLFGWLHVLPVMTAAQAPVREPLKQGTLLVAAAAQCPPPAAAAAPAPSEAERRAARDLAQRALQAALLGDSVAARDHLRAAATLDRTDADLAYRLGRANEAVRASPEAVTEYCRFLALASDAPEAIEVRTRLASLAASAMPDPRTTETLAAFQSGVSAYEGGRLADAEAAFSMTIEREPQWPEPYYNRAVTLLAHGRRDAAVRDFEQYLRLRPETSDRGAVVARIATLRRAMFSPATALAAGLALPGGGQYYTRRPGRGAVTSLAVGAALVIGLVQRTTTSTVEQTGTDPFGNPYTYQTSRQTRERPYAVSAAVAGIAIAVSSAVEAYRYAVRLRR